MKIEETEKQEKAALDKQKRLERAFQEMGIFYNVTQYNEPGLKVIRLEAKILVTAQ